MSAGMDFSWEGKGKVLYACIVLFKSHTIAKKLYFYLLQSIYERTLHFRKLTRKKKKKLLSEIKKLLDSPLSGVSSNDIFVFQLIIERKIDIPRKYAWLERKTAELLLSVRKYRNYPHRVVIGSDLEKGQYSFARRLETTLQGTIDVYVDDKACEVGIADILVNYARLTRNLAIKKHHC